MNPIEIAVNIELQQLDTTDRQEPSEVLKTKTSRLKEKIEKLKIARNALLNLRHTPLHLRTREVPVAVVHQEEINKVIENK